MGKRQQRVLDFLSQGFKGWEILEMRAFFFHLLPELLDRIVIRRVARQLEDLKPCGLLGEESFGLGAGVILRAILNQDDGLRGVLQHPCEKGNVGCGVEAAFLPLIQEAPGEVIDQPEDFIAFALPAGLDVGLLAAPGPGVRECPPLGEGGFIAK